MLLAPVGLDLLVAGHPLPHVGGVAFQVVEIVHGNDVVLVLQERVEIDHRVGADAGVLQPRMGGDDASLLAFGEADADVDAVARALLDHAAAVAMGMRKGAQEDLLEEVAPALQVLCGDAPVLDDDELDVGAGKRGLGARARRTWVPPGGRGQSLGAGETGGNRKRQSPRAEPQGGSLTSLRGCASPLRSGTCPAWGGRVPAARGPAGGRGLVRRSLGAGCRTRRRGSARRPYPTSPPKAWRRRCGSPC